MSSRLVVCLCACLLLIGDTIATDITCENVTTVSPNSDQLEMILNDVEQNTTQDCLNVTLLSGNYTVTRFFALNYTNFILHGNNSLVTFSVSSDSYDPDLPPYALNFMNAEFVVISGVRFEYSPGIIGFENVTKVVIRDSYFRWFLQGAVDIYQCYYIEISHSVFEHNGPVFITRRDTYRGHAGGVSIGYNDYNLDNFNSTSLPDEVGAWIDDCRFLNNTSDPQKGPLLAAGQVFNEFIPIGRGGALAVAINSTFEFNIVITRCVVVDNVARSFCGGIYLVFSGFSPHSSTVNDTIIINNNSAGPGGLSMGYIEGSVNGQRVSLNVHNCYFERNSGNYGGGLFLYADRKIIIEDGDIDSNYIGFINNCTFVRNVGNECGAAVSLSSQLFFGTNEIIPVVIFQDCFFEDNYGGRGGVITTGHLPLVFRGNNHFYNNKGRVLVVIGTRAEVSGDLAFVGNIGSGRDGSVIDGGAIYTTSFSQLVIQRGTNISLIGNFGIFGAALIVNNMAAISLPQAYRHVQFNPLCVLRYQEGRRLTEEWEDVSMSFYDNSARYGSSVLISGLDYCSFPNRDLDRVFRWSFTEYGNNTNTAHSPNINSSKWYVETFAVKINISDYPMSAYPGEEVTVDFIGYDELARPTTSSIRLSNVRKCGHLYNYTLQDNASLLFTPSVATSEVISTARIKTSFVIQASDDDLQEDDVLRDAWPIQVESLFTEVTSQVCFNISLLPCPVGFTFVSRPSSNDNHTEYYCTCASETNENIRHCTGGVLLLQEGLWAAVEYDDVNRPKLFTHLCPSRYCHNKCSLLRDSFQLSCVSVYSDERQNEQCTNNREGVLCGECTNNTGFSALLNNCVDCTYTSIILIPVLIFVDIVVIGLLLVLKFGPPSWLYPTLFYVQLIPFLGEGFRFNFAPVQPYAHYVSSALSFYFVYDFCLVPHLSSVFSYALRYIPFLMTIAIAIAMAAFRYWNKIVRDPWYGLWWVTLLQYPHLIHTSLTILNCPKLPNLEDGTLSYRWRVNGNIECFGNEGHIVLGILAIATLIFCTLLIPLIFIYAQGYVEKPLLLSTSIKPLSAWFKKEYPWWPAVELMKRLIFIVLVTPAIELDYPVAVYLGLTLVICSFIDPYQATLSNYIDMVLTANALVLIMFRDTRDSAFFSPNSVFIDSRNSTNPKGSVPMNWGLLIFYYIPVAFFVLFCLIVLLLKSKLKYSEYKKRRLELKRDAVTVEDLGYSNASYQDARTSNVIDTLPRNSVPMSTLVRHLNTQDSSNNELDEEDREGRERERHTHGDTPVRLTRKERMKKRLSWTTHQVSWRSYTARIKNTLKKRESMNTE